MRPVSNPHKWPKKADVTAWVMMLREVSWLPVEDMLALHNALHKVFGADPSDAVIEGEQALSKSLRGYGIEHRHKDALAEAAGTVVAEPADPTMDEVGWYLQPMTVHSEIVKLSQGVENPSQIFVSVDGRLLPDSVQKALVKTLNKMMPPGVSLKPLPKKPREEFIAEMGIYSLMLTPVYSYPLVKPWKEIVATAPAAVFKEDKLQITVGAPVKTEEVVLKEGEEPERYMLAPVLIPEEEDVQGEIYSAAEVRKACHWWAENSGQFSHRHVLQGGQPLCNNEIVLLENYIMPADCEIDGTKIKAGTWMLGAGARSDEIWQKAQAGQLGAWSIGADVTSWMEDAPE